MFSALRRPNTPEAAAYRRVAGGPRDLRHELSDQDIKDPIRWRYR